MGHNREGVHVERCWRSSPAFDGQIMYTDTENTGAPMVPESTRREPDDPTDARRFREEMVLSHRLPE